jgi:hypothetical protein
MKMFDSGTVLAQATGVNPLVRQFELAHWLFVTCQNSQVAVALFYRRSGGAYDVRAAFS